MRKPSAALAGKERIGFFRPASMPGMEVKVVYQSDRRWHVFHERYAFCVCRTAASGIRYRGIEERIQDGDVAVHEPGETHCNTFVQKPADFKVLFIERSLMLQVAEELGQPGTLHFARFIIRDDPLLSSALYRLCAAIEAGGSASAQEYLFAATLARLATHAECLIPKRAFKHGKAVVERAKAYLQERFSEAVSLAELAAACGLSRFHLVHEFSKETGLSPHAYQLHVRIERSRRLLEKGFSSAVVAANLGFADQSHFTRHFRRIMHVTPAQYAGRPHFRLADNQRRLGGDIGNRGSKLP